MAAQASELRVIGSNLKSLGQELRNGEIELKLAAELANIYGKELKAQQLILAERIFEKQAGNPVAISDQSGAAASLPQ